MAPLLLCIDAADIVSVAAVGNFVIETHSLPHKLSRLKLTRSTLVVAATQPSSTCTSPTRVRGGGLCKPLLIRLSERSAVPFRPTLRVVLLLILRNTPGARAGIITLANKALTKASMSASEKARFCDSVARSTTFMAASTCRISDLTIETGV